MILSLVESLRGDALTIAMQIGIDRLMNIDQNGLSTLRSDIRDHIFPILKDEVNSLFREGQRKGKGGILSRHPKESMKNYIVRRKRWYAMLIRFDPTKTFSDETLGELLLDNALISNLIEHCC